MPEVRAVLEDVAQIARGNLWWMSWNTLLAMLPAVLALLVFRYDGRRRLGWWAGVTTIVLFLPNAPYVVTDLVHLRGDVAQAGSDATVYAGVLPMYAAFIAVGFGCYAIVLSEAGRAVRAAGRPRLVLPMEIGLHALCALGVLLGRVARLNSWDTVTQPEGTLERALDTLTWRASPAVLVVLFVVIWLGHAVVRTLARGLSAATSRRPLSAA